MAMMNASSGTTVGEVFVAIKPDGRGFADDVVDIVKPAGEHAGEVLGDGITRGADGRLRDARGKFVSAGKGIGDGLEEGTRSGIQGVGESLKGMVAAIGVAIIANKIKDFIGGAIAEATEAAKVTAQTAAVIKSTGGAANVTSDQIGNLATRLQNMAAIDDDVIRSGANMLLTFTNIRNQVDGQPGIFDRATKAALNMSVALGTDMTSASMTLGKALNDPIEGVAALRRVGVRLTDEQEQQIATFMFLGDTAAAQGVILDELGKEFGGSAAAQATAGAKLQVAYGNLKESIGTALLPVVEKLSKTLVPIIKSLTENRGALIGVGIAIASVLVPAFIAWAASAASAAIATLGALAPILGIIAGVGALIGVAVLLYYKWDEIWSWMRDHPAIAAIIFILMGPILLPIIGLVAAIRFLRDNWKDIWDWIQNAFQDTVNFLEPIWDRIYGAVAKVIEVLKPVAQAWWDMQMAIKDALVAVAEFLWPWVERFFSWVADFGKAILSIGKFWWDLKDDIWNAIEAVVGFLLDIPNRVASIGQAIADGIANGFKSAWNTVADFINDIIPDKISIPLAPDIDFPDNPIPKFHNGGMVPGLPGQEMLAILRAGERVIPAGESTGGGSGLTVMGDLVIQDRDVLSTLDYWSRTRLAGV